VLDDGDEAVLSENHALGTQGAVREPRLVRVHRGHRDGDAPRHGEGKVDGQGPLVL
jgi:hypothetical protein